MKKSLYLLFLKCPHTIHYARPYVLEKKDSVIYVIEYQKRNYWGRSFVYKEKKNLIVNLGIFVVLTTNLNK